MFSFSAPGLPSFGDLAWHKPVDYALLNVALPANTLAPAGAPVPGQTMTANANGALAGAAAVWIAPTVGDRILVRAEASPGNGLWIVTAIGGATSKWQLTRATDADTPAELPIGSLVVTLTGGTDGNGGRSVFAQGFQYGGWQTVPDELTALTVTTPSGLVVPLSGSTVPTINNGGTATFANVICTWVQIGALVVCRFSWNVTANGSGATALTVTGMGLPQSSSNPRFLGDRAGVGVAPVLARMVNSGGALAVNSMHLVSAPTTALTGADLVNTAGYSFHAAYMTA